MDDFEHDGRKEMRSHVPLVIQLQAYSQEKSLDKRERKLRRAIAMMAPVEKLRLAAEELRAAQLLLLKG